MAALLLGTAVALFVAEGIARWGLEPRWLPDLLYYQGVSADLAVHRSSADSELVYELVPAATHEFPGIEVWGDDPRTVQTNALGFRDVERSIDKPEGTLRIVCVGGSNTYGAAVTQGRTWPAQLEVALSSLQSRPVEVWNLGVDGYVPRQKATLARRALREFDPDLLIWQQYNLGPRHFLPGPWGGLRARLRDNPVLYWENLEGAPHPSSGWRWSLFVRSGLARTSAIVGTRRHRAALNLDPGTFPVDLWEELDRAALLDYRRLAAEAAQSAPLLMLLLPTRLDGDPFTRLAGRTLDLAAEPDPPPLPDVSAVHPGADVYRWYADVIAARLVATGCAEAPRTCRLTLPPVADEGELDEP